MRWDELFTDLEAQWGVEQEADRASVRREEERLRVARTTLRERLAGAASARGGALKLRLRDGSRLVALPLVFGKDWLSAELPGREQAIVPLAAVASVSFSAAQLAASTEAPLADGRAKVVDRLGVQVVLRDLARRRVALELLCEGERMTGTIDRVGTDHLDLAIHPHDRPRRSAQVFEVRTLALAAVLCVVVR